MRWHEVENWRLCLKRRVFCNRVARHIDVVVAYEFNVEQFVLVEVNNPF